MQDLDHASLQMEKQVNFGDIVVDGRTIRDEKKF